MVAFVASRLMPRDTALGHPISPHQKSLYAVGVAFAAYGTAVLPPEGNGLIAAFVAAIALGIWRPDIRECFEERSEDLIEVVKLGVFLVFGATLTFGALFADGWAAVGIVAFTLLAARPVAVFTALAGTRQVDFAEKAFMAWFGPKGVATMTFALLVLGSSAAEGERIANIAALAVLTSVIAHGVTDQPGSEWIGRRADRRARRYLTALELARVRVDAEHGELREGAPALPGPGQRDHPVGLRRQPLAEHADLLPLGREVDLRLRLRERLVLVQPDRRLLAGLRRDERDDEHGGDHDDAHPRGTAAGERRAPAPDLLAGALRRLAVWGARAVGRNSFPMFVNSTITRTTIAQMIEIASIAYLEALLVRLERQELDLPLAASVVDHRTSPTPPGCGGGPVAGGSACVNPAAAAISRRFSYTTQATSTATMTTMPSQVTIM